jgi:hypothetical protein
VEEVAALQATITLDANTMVASEPSFVDETGTKLTSARIGQTIGIRTAVSNNVNQNLTFAYLVQIKDSNDVTISLSWLDDLDTNVVEPSIFWTSDTTGELLVEVFLWQSIDDPVPLSYVKSSTIMVNE